MSSQIVKFKHNEELVELRKRFPCPQPRDYEDPAIDLATTLPHFAFP